MKNSTHPDLKHGFFRVLLMAALLTGTSYAQTEIVPTKTKNYYGGFGYLGLSGEQLNLSDLNRSLSAHNYSTLNLTGASFGGGGSFVIHNFMIGGGGAWLMSSKTKNPDNTVDVKGGYGFFNFGYLLHPGKRALFYPTLGIGGGSYDIIVSKNNPQQDFSQQLNAPADMITLEAGGWMATAQLTYLYFLNKNGREGFCIGLKAGYKYSPANWKSAVNNTTLVNSPNINMNGFYVTLIIGGGSVGTN